MHWTSTIMSDIIPEIKRLLIIVTDRMPLLSHSWLAWITSLRLICWTFESNTSWTGGGLALTYSGGLLVEHPTSTNGIKRYFLIRHLRRVCHHLLHGLVAYWLQQLHYADSHCPFGAFATQEKQWFWLLGYHWMFQRWPCQALGD